MNNLHRFYPRCVLILLLCVSLLLVGGPLLADNQVLGEVAFEGASKVEQNAGVWIDGQYLGYLKELKGSKKLLLLPGEHEVIVRQAGYVDFNQKVTIQGGQKQLLEVKLVKDLRYHMPDVTAEIKLSVDPDRAAVFVDGLFAGHAGELGGLGRSLLVAEALHERCARMSSLPTISLPTIRRFRCSIRVAGAQKRGDFGFMRASNGRGPDPSRRRRSSCSRPTARRNVRPRISSVSRACCMSTAMPASSGWPPIATSCSPPAGRTHGASSTKSRKPRARLLRPRR